MLQVDRGRWLITELRVGVEDVDQQLDAPIRLALPDDNILALG